MIKHLLMSLVVASLLVGAPRAVRGDAGAGPRPSAAEARGPSAAVSGRGTIFEPNRGQTDPAVRFLARGPGFTAWLTEGGAVFAGPSRRGEPAPIFRMDFAGGAGKAVLEGEDSTGGRSNYFRGRDPAGWRTGIPHFRGVLVREAYPGIDVRWRNSDRGALRYDLLVRPGADPSVVAVEFGPEARTALLPDGTLEVRTRAGSMRHSPPRLWQESGGRRLPVAGGFDLRPDGRVGFRAGRYDRRLALVVDPTVDFSTYQGGSALDGYIGMDMAVTAAGDVFLVGDTRSTDFPLMAPMDTWSGSSSDGVLTRLGPKGTTVVFTTFFGGNQIDLPRSIALGPDGTVSVLGRTNSYDYPTTPGVIREAYNGYAGLFLSRFKGDGSAFVFSTLLGAAGEYPGDIAVDGSGAIYVTGWASSDWPTTPGAAQGYVADQDVIVAKIAADGKSFHWSSFIGGNIYDGGVAVAVGGDGSVFVAGDTSSTDFATTGAFQVAYGGGYRDGFVAKIAPGGGSFAWKTYIGGNRDDEATGIAVDGQGRVVVTGFTDSTTGFPVKDSLNGRMGGKDGFLARFTPQGALDFSTILGGSSNDVGTSVALDAKGGMVVGGLTTSTNFPLKDPLQSTLGNVANDQDAFLLRVSPDAKSLLFSTYLGGGNFDQGRSVGVDGDGSFYLAGSTSSVNFPVKLGAYQMSLSGSDDFFVTKILPIVGPTDLTATAVSSSQVDLYWTDASNNEDSFDISRRIGAGAFQTVASVPAGTAAWSYESGVGSSTYGFRVRAVRSDATSAWSNEALATTFPGPPGPPVAPAGLAVEIDGGGVARLLWEDRSESEDFFEVFRRVDGGPSATLATTLPEATGYADGALLADRTYGWRVRSGNSGGFSDPTEEATATTPPTLEAVLVKGKLVDSVKFGKDSLLLSGVLGLIGGGVPDLVARGLEVRLGGWTGQRVLLVPAGDPGWKVGKGRATWKSPKGSLTKAQVTVDPATGTFTVKVSRITLDAAPASPVRLAVGAGSLAGTILSDWIESKPGRWAFP